MNDDHRRIVDPQCHEFAANWNTAAHGLRPWFAADNAIKQGDGSVESTFHALGELWDVTLYYQDSAVLPPTGGETAGGSTVEHDTIREFRLQVDAVDDDLGIRGVNYHLRPRWYGMRAQKDDGTRVNLPVPDELVEGQDAINIRISGSNIDFHDYGELLREAAEAVGISHRYFRDDDRHRTSNVQDGARYVRVERDCSGPIHSRTGPIASLAHVLENDREGYRKLVQNDTDERGNRKPGYYHTCTLGLDRVQEVFPNHQLPVELKHYYAREAADRSAGDPLSHPKLEADYQVSRSDKTLRYTDEALDQLKEELDEWLYATLSDAGLNLRAGGGVYVADDVFAAENELTPANIVDLDLTEIRHEQEAVVYKHLADGMSPTQRETLQTLVTDGGDVAPKDIAADTGRHRDTVYDALQNMQDLVQHEYDSVSLRSTYVSELVADAIETAESEITRATNAAAKAVNAAERGLDERTSAFIAWCESHGVNYRGLEGDGNGKIDIGEVDDRNEVRRILREGLELWTDMRKDEAAFRGANLSYRMEIGGTEYSSDYLKDEPGTTERFGGTVWEILR